MRIKLFSGLFLSLFISFGVLAQKTVISGIVTDEETGEPLPFVNIVFLHSHIGAISDFDGIFYIETSYATDTLIASSLGYIPQKKFIKTGMTQKINFTLKPTSLAIEEVVVRPGENPAFKILRSISENKKYNNPDRFNSYQYKSYNKLRLDINNIGEKFKNQRILKEFQFVFDHMDSSEVFGKNYLPVLITESVSKYYFQQNPSVEREVIEAFKISGIQNNTISQYTGKMYQKLNIYNNFITLFEPGFVSPIADFGRLYYKYVLEDSAVIDNSLCFKISFKPKRKQERTFYGYFWVADTSFAIKKVQLRVSKDVNINFLNDMIAVHEYNKINDSIWFLTSEDLMLDLYLTDKNTGFFGRKTSTYDSIQLNIAIPEEVTEIKTDIVANNEELNKRDDYWEENRKVELSDEDIGVYEMVDSVTNVPTFKRIYKLVEMFVDYYYVLGPIELGPYYTFFSHNPIEGYRFKLGGRTSNNFSTKWRFGGHVAYGLKDERIKYGAIAEHMFKTNPRISAGISYYHDIRQLGKSENAFLDDNFFVSIFRRTPNYQLTLVDQYNAYFEREWFQGFSNIFSLRYQSVHGTEYVPFKVIEGSDTIAYPDITSAEVTLSTHFSYREKFLLGKFERVSLGSKYPILDLDLTFGPKGVLGSDYEYYKVRIKITDKIETNPIGYLRYRITAGKVFGILPYPLLKLHEGNETYIYDPLAFNMMNYYEFVSDEYAILFAEHHFQGFFFNQIPLLRWLKFREVIGGKILVGRLSEANRNVMEFPEGLTDLNKPYIEAGVGLENILRFFRVDAMWRFTYLENENISRFGLRATMQLTF
ncbi:MAG: carboxypeptidase-like regulatory domain-containing protein [Bacteroidales bacterium]|nr:carboxypeptidase-like regulatory domain-containing protein [Bacteroidales bacterium]